MSSNAKRVKDDVVRRRLETVVQVLSIMEEEAHRKSFWERFIICLQYLFFCKFDRFFKKSKGK